MPPKKKLTRSQREELLNSKGLLSREQAERLKSAKDFLSRHEPTEDPHLLTKEPHQLSPKEFKSVYGKQAIRLKEFNSSDGVTNFLDETYQALIIEALEELKDDVNMEGINQVRFKNPEFRKLALKYLRAKGLSIHT